MADFCGRLNLREQPGLEQIACFLGPQAQRASQENLSLAWHGCSYDQGLLFCGQIYNFAELAQGQPYPNPAALARHLLETLGPHQGLAKINGIFSLAYYKDSTLLLAKDHFGVAPLYYGQVQNDFIFSSQLKALSGYPGFSKQVNRQALSGFIKYNWVPANLCIYQGLHKVPPGHYVIKKPGLTPGIVRYFDPVQEALDARAYAQKYGPWADDDLVQEFERLLNLAIERRLHTTGGQGLLLSGGMDSSLLAASLAPKQTLSTYTIGFVQRQLNEADAARLVAEKVKSIHHESILTGSQAAALLPRLLDVYEEPFADQSQVPTCAAMLLANKEQCLWLGDGGDELFMGYPRHLAHLRYAVPADPITGQRNLATWLHYPLRAFLHFVLKQPINYTQRHITNRGYKSLVINHQEPDLGLQAYHHIYALQSPSRQAQLLDILTYLPGNGVIKASRLAASLGLNIACPLLDVDLFRFAQTLPVHLLAQDGQGKLIMRKLLYRHYPRAWVDRPKSGFGAPMGQWLQNELAPWSGQLLDESAIKSQGFFNYAAIARYRSLLGKRSSAVNKLWAVLMFQTWAKREGII